MLIKCKNHNLMGLTRKLENLIFKTRLTFLMMMIKILHSQLCLKQSIFNKYSRWIKIRRKTRNRHKISNRLRKMMILITISQHGWVKVNIWRCNKKLKRIKIALKNTKMQSWSSLNSSNSSLKAIRIKMSICHRIVLCLLPRSRQLLSIQDLWTKYLTRNKKKQWASFCKWDTPTIRRILLWFNKKTITWI